MQEAVQRQVCSLGSGPVFLPGKFHGMVGYSPWGCKELDTSEHTHTFFGLQRVSNMDQPLNLCRTEPWSQPDPDKSAGFPADAIEWKFTGKENRQVYKQMGQYRTNQEDYSTAWEYWPTKYGIWTTGWQIWHFYFVPEDRDKKTQLLRIRIHSAVDIAILKKIK